VAHGRVARGKEAEGQYKFGDFTRGIFNDAATQRIDRSGHLQISEPESATADM